MNSKYSLNLKHVVRYCNLEFLSISRQIYHSNYIVLSIWQEEYYIDIKKTVLNVGQEKMITYRDGAGEIPFK